MKLPQKDHLSQEDWMKWAKDLLIFSIPAIIAFLTAFQTGGFEFAFGAGYSALLASGINLYGKYKSGVDVEKTLTDLSNQKMPEVKPVVPEAKPTA